MYFPTKPEEYLMYGITRFKDDDEVVFDSDPLLIIEYNQPGLASRTPGYVPIAFSNFNQASQSNSVITFNHMQTLDNAIVRLYMSYNNHLLGRQDPIVGRVNVVIFAKANKFEVSE
ncbi:4087_t:CDS:2 [Funneliformis geosporum]|uniref:4087_t:CDS:1 n=1 Tax=Funneliformis geosporum TaxID=1117311 RepID=A0A9W4SQI9_9GLOM|nr:4087_t:CDS:2 [Funneliformis geosporum]